MAFQGPARGEVLPGHLPIMSAAESEAAESAGKRRALDTLNRTVRSLFTSPERRFFKPDPLRAPSNPLNYRAFNIRTKMAVVRLLRRKWAERDEKRPEVGPRAGPHGSDNLPGMAAFCGIPTADQERKKNVPTGRLAEGEELSSNPLCVIFQWLSITHHLMN